MLRGNLWALRVKRRAKNIVVAEEERRLRSAAKPSLNLAHPVSRSATAARSIAAFGSGYDERGGLNERLGN